MKTLLSEEMEAIEGGRFLGIGHHSERVGNAHDNADCPSGRSVTHTETFTIFWVTAVHYKNTEECLAPNI